MVIAKKQTVRGSGMQPLAEKAINDNFNNIFQKVGGNIEYMDFADDVKAKWDSMVTDGNLQSKIEQNPEWIRISFNGSSDYVEFANDNNMYFRQADGSFFKIGLDGMQKHKAGVVHDIHYLNYEGEVTLSGGGIITTTITLPSEFQGKNFNVSYSVKSISYGAMPTFLSSYWIYTLNKNISAGTFQMKTDLDYYNIKYVVQGEDLLYAQDNTDYGVTYTIQYSVTA